MHWVEIKVDRFKKPLSITLLTKTLITKVNLTFKGKSKLPWRWRYKVHADRMGNQTDNPQLVP